MNLNSKEIWDPPRRTDEKSPFSSVIYLKSFMKRLRKANRPHQRCISLREIQPPKRTRSFLYGKALKCKPTASSGAQHERGGKMTL